MLQPDATARLLESDADCHQARRFAASCVPDPVWLAAGYREAILREKRVHAALQIPWQVSDGVSSYLILLPGPPRAHDGVAENGADVDPLASTAQRATWTVGELRGWARDVLGCSDAEISRALHASVSTLRRWARGETIPRGRHRMQCDTLNAVRTLLAAVFTTPERASRWLRRTHELRGSIAALDLIKIGAVSVVRAVLARTEPCA